MTRSSLETAVVSSWSTAMGGILGQIEGFQRKCELDGNELTTRMSRYSIQQVNSNILFFNRQSPRLLKGM